MNWPTCGAAITGSAGWSSRRPACTGGTRCCGSPAASCGGRRTLLRRLGDVHPARRRQDLRRRPPGNARLPLRRPARHSVAGERRRPCRRSEKEIDHDYARNDAASVGCAACWPSSAWAPCCCRCCPPGAVQQPAKPDAPDNRQPDLLNDFNFAAGDVLAGRRARRPRRSCKSWKRSWRRSRTRRPRSPPRWRRCGRGLRRRTTLKAPLR